MDCDRYDFLRSLRELPTNVANRAGRSVLCCFVDHIYHYSKLTTSVSASLHASFDSALRLLTRYCGPDTGMMFIHHDIHGQSVGESFIPSVHQALEIFPDEIADTFLFLPIRCLLAHDCDLEEADGFGRSLLLAAIFDVKRNHSAQIISLLLQAGADPLARDHKGQGALHYILVTVSACNRAHIKPALYEATKSTLVQLLLAGCNPNLGDEGDYTPSDRALTSTAWMLWCEALLSAGFQPLEVLQEDDRLLGITFDEGYLEQKYQEALASRSPTPKTVLEREEPTEFGEYIPACSFCGLPDNCTRTRAPFDPYANYLIEWGEGFTHLWLPNHLDGTDCANERKLDSCGHESHQEGEAFSKWSSQELSWRKHVAYRMWVDNILSGPREAYTWATGLSDDWEATATLEDASSCTSS